jgi:hypothetical protein
MKVDGRIYNQQVEVYNRTVELANGGALPAAIDLLEKLLPRTRSLLEQMKSDLARLKGE